ncbi:MAG: alpha/beta fold hydrolase [Candidatus Eisenbacteria bacterium]|nr:alpha/beta fold hydrolase [Candidatus Eisenbacteria bacterium]
MRRLLGLALAAVIGIVVWLSIPLSRSGLTADPRPVADYAEALRRIDGLRAEDGAAIAPECRTRLFTHGARAARVVVMFHGLTNCPAQFDSLGRIAFARGANVLIPRLPRHGWADRMTDQLARSDAGELRTFADRAIDLAHGLGDSVTVVGLSVGGTLAAWAAEQRPDVDRAVLIAPMLGVARAPGAWTPIVSRLAGALPNLFVWWDDARRRALLGPKHVYPRFATRVVAATLRLGWMVVEDAARRPPACRTIAVVTVGGDPAVDNGLCDRAIDGWRRSGRAVETYRFPARLDLSHDIVDPEQVKGNPALTYPVLVRLIGP